MKLNKTLIVIFVVFSVCFTAFANEPNIATVTIKGRVIDSNGQPATNLPYWYVSENLEFADARNAPKTNEKGEFTIERLLPNELFSFLVFPAENTLCVWKRIDPNSKNLEFVLKTADYIELPSDWFPNLMHYTIAMSMTYAPDSKVQFTFEDVNGNKVSLADKQFEHKPLLVNIYGSWCGSCALEIPYLVDFKNKYAKDGLEIIGIAFENGTKDEQIAKIRKTIEKYKINYPVLLGGKPEKDNIRNLIKGLELFYGFPTTLYITRDGKVNHIQVAFFTATESMKQWQLKAMENNIKSLLTR